MPAESHTIMDGKVHIYRREGSRFWQCAVYLGGPNHRQSTKQDSLVMAKDFAREWYMERYADERLRRRGVPLPKPGDRSAAELASQTTVARKPIGPTFQEAADIFVAEYQVITLGERNEEYVAQKSRHLKRYLLPFFGEKALSEVTAGLISEYRVHRLNPPEPDVKETRTRGRPKAKLKRPAQATLHQEWSPSARC
jgi:hypothetical protein